MTIALFILTGLLALAFLGAGLMKIARPKEALASSGMSWAEQLNGSTVKLIGLAEAVGAVGLIVPLLTGIATVLSPIAAVALLIVMVGAVATHLRRKEGPGAAVVLAVLLLVSAVLGFLYI